MPLLLTATPSGRFPAGSSRTVSTLPGSTWDNAVAGSARITVTRIFVSTWLIFFGFVVVIFILRIPRIPGVSYASDKERNRAGGVLCRSAILFGLIES